MVKRIRGVSFSTRVSPQIESRIIYAARGIFNRFIPDVHIFTDHRSGASGGRYVSNPLECC
jgi:RNA 3'-terminal phosphate cyclase-like protein